MKVLAENKKAWFEYFVEEKIECGVELKGCEVKSVRKGNVSIKESWACIENGELLVKGMNITPYEQTANFFRQDACRARRLLIHKQEIRKLYATVVKSGMTLVPLKVYFNDSGKVKVEIGVCKGKKLHDKRAVAKEKDSKMAIDRAMKDRGRG